MGSPSSKNEKISTSTSPPTTSSTLTRISSTVIDPNKPRWIEVVIRDIDTDRAKDGIVTYSTYNGIPFDLAVSHPNYLKIYYRLAIGRPCKISYIRTKSSPYLIVDVQPPPIYQVIDRVKGFIEIRDVEEESKFIEVALHTFPLRDTMGNRIRLLIDRIHISRFNPKYKYNFTYTYFVVPNFYLIKEFEIVD